MIRFTCPSCGRAYHLPEALARLALLCKGCGGPLAVPDASTEPEPEPLPESPPDQPFGPPDVVVTVDLFPDADTIRKRASAARDVPDPQDTVDLFPKADVAPSPSSTMPEQPVPPVKQYSSAAGVRHVPVLRARALGLIVDVAIGLGLAGTGVLLGEFATRRGTGDILREAGSAPKFPTVDLLLWLGCVATLVLGYVLFANRGKSVGAWVRRRAEGR